MSEQMQLAIYHSLSPAQADVAKRAEERIKSRTVLTVIENGKDLIEVKASLGHGYFMSWIEQAFNGTITDRTARLWMQAADQYGGKTELSSVLGSKVMQLLSAPSVPDEVRAEVEERATNGEKITVAEVERLKREAKAAKEDAERLRLECKDLAEIGGESAKRARDLEKQLDLLREGSDAAVAKAAEKAREEARKESHAAITRAEVDAEKCRQAAEDAQREAEAAYEAAEAARAAVDDAVKAARVAAEKKAAEDAGTLAGKMAEEALAKRRSELLELERQAQRAKEKAEKYVESERQLAEVIRKHQERIKTIGSSELEAPAQIESAKRLMSVVYDAMTDIHGFDHEPTPDAAKQWDIAGQMCIQLAEAIRSFCAPRLEDAS